MSRRIIHLYAGDRFGDLEVVNPHVYTGKYRICSALLICKRVLEDGYECGGFRTVPRYQLVNCQPTKQWACLSCIRKSQQQREIGQIEEKSLPAQSLPPCNGCRHPWYDAGCKRHGQFTKVEADPRNRPTTTMITSAGLYRDI